MARLLNAPTSTKLPSGKTAPVQEVFSSIQGEGIYVGKRQVFVRFAHCHLKCAYCDTPMTSVTGNCHVEYSSGTGLTEQLVNPLTPDALIAVVDRLVASTPHHSISFTGGEPLLYHAFLRDVLPHVRQSAPTYLETSGTQPEFLESVLPWVDIVAMDIKLPSTTKEPAQYENHARFYRMIQQNPDTQCFIKLVFNDGTTEDELAAVRQIVTDRRTPIILQPETGLANRRVVLSPERMLAIESRLSAHFEDVRVIPQTHKMLNVF